MSEESTYANINIENDWLALLFVSFFTSLLSFSIDFGNVFVKLAWNQTPNADKY